MFSFHFGKLKSVTYKFLYSQVFCKEIFQNSYVDTYIDEFTMKITFIEFIVSIYRIF